ncbi:site-2 protease family protein, partial [Bulleidia extructa]
MNLIIFLLVLSFIVAIHEFGHLLAAKSFGVYCYEYAIGMGPQFWKVRKKETTYALRLLPIGGFVAM